MQVTNLFLTINCFCHKYISPPWCHFVFKTKFVEAGAPYDEAHSDYSLHRHHSDDHGHFAPGIVGTGEDRHMGRGRSDELGAEQRLHCSVARWPYPDHGRKMGRDSLYLPTTEELCLRCETSKLDEEP